ncbi:hypothetical protein HUG10_04245 [Halorarum halophilum]|uniref:Lipoprotein n=1 Tax=Halorarum halophilum TaxID=2743090 RepID=A0A7D5K6J9_9EURY|nr:hypothetical protein [Halobaculum halophilum]QLG26799.1 hypothetical protein HUG10_04245 [Halobaculum halophilum]
MVPITRRDALRGVAALLPVVAGCNDVDTPRSIPTEGRRGPENVVVDPEHLTLRAPDESPVVWTATEETGTTDERSRRHVHRLVADTETARRLRFDDRVDADDAREFLDATDYDAETVYVEQSRVGECFRTELCYVGWSADEVRTDYGRQLRDVSVSCEADARDTVATLVRIPDTLDPDEVRSHGSGMSSSGCHLPPWIHERSDVATGTSETTGSTGSTEANR